MKHNSNKMGALVKNVQDAFMSIGFAPDEVGQQLQKLSDAITFSVVKRLLKENILSAETSPEQIQSYIEQHKNDQALTNIFEEEMKQVSEEYLNAIIESLADEQREPFLKKLQQVPNSV